MDCDSTYINVIGTKEWTFHNRVDTGRPFIGKSLLNHMSCSIRQTEVSAYGEERHKTKTLLPILEVYKMAKATL